MRPLVLRPLSPLQLVSAAILFVRRAPLVFVGGALLGIAPLAASIFWLWHTMGAPPPGPRKEAVVLAALGVTIALALRSLVHAALLCALASRLRGEPSDLGAALQESRAGSFSVLLAGGVINLVAAASAFLAFGPWLLFGHIFALALPRIVLEGRRPGAALSAGASGKAFVVGLFSWLVGAALFFNLYLAMRLVLALGRAFFDLDTSYAAAVLSLDNPVVALGVGFAAMLLLEPMRVVAAGLLVLEAKARREGGDLRVALRGLGAGGPGAGRPGVGTPTTRGARVALFLAVLMGIALASPRLIAATPPPGESGPRVDRGSLAEPARLRDALREVLARPEYAGLAPSAWDEAELTPPPPQQRLPDLDRKRGGSDGVSGFTVLAVLIAVAAVGAAAGLAFVGFSARRRRLDAPPATLAAHDDVSPAAAAPLGVDATLRSPSAWRAEADALAAAGRHRDALRLLYLAVLAALHAARAIEYDAGRTNGDFVRSLRGDAAARGAFRALTHRFERVWYGEHAVGAAEYAEQAASSDALVAGTTP